MCPWNYFFFLLGLLMYVHAVNFWCMFNCMWFMIISWMIQVEQSLTIVNIWLCTNSIYTTTALPVNMYLHNDVHQPTTLHKWIIMHKRSRSHLYNQILYPCKRCFWCETLHTTLLQNNKISALKEWANNSGFTYRNTSPIDNTHTQSSCSFLPVGSYQGREDMGATDS